MSDEPDTDILLLRQLLDYDPETGMFSWAKPNKSWFASEAHWNAFCSAQAGQTPLAVPHSQGYLCGGVGARQLLTHRVAWAWFYGEWPCEEIDHENHNRTDNRIKNLRAANRVANSRNASLRSDNTSGVTGVSWARDRKKWVAMIHLPGGKAVHLGRHDRFDDAVAARKAAEERYGFHPNHGAPRAQEDRA